MSMLRQRKKEDIHKDVSPSLVEHDGQEIDSAVKPFSFSLSETIIFRCVLLVAVFTTYYRIWYPDQVVFDEVHFGKFAGYYLRHTYFFDVHPPLGKMMFAGAGYLLGFDGHFEFEEIGKNYVLHNVPYVGLRMLPATLNVLSGILVYSIMKDSGYAGMTSALAACMYLLDNAMVTQNRLILLDSMLIFFMLTSIYSYIRFRHMRHQPFTMKWWSWLVATGVAMACTIGIKMVGLFTIIAIGIPVMIDLWDLIDVKRGLSTRQISKHFGARVFGLIVVPIALYLFWFYLHFTILTQSGPGNAFMSVRFQDTLGDNPLAMKALDIHYYDNITLSHKDTSAYLYSHDKRYPLRYDDGRISSRGQQVVAAQEPSENSYWRILPTKELVNPERTAVQHSDVFQLEHIGTGTLLLTHDVASPLLSTNQEVTTVEKNTTRYNETLFTVVMDDLSEGKKWQTHRTQVRIVHVITQVAIWSHQKSLPSWADNLQDVNGNKLKLKKSNYWVAMDIMGRNATEINSNEKKQVKPLSFWRKFYELQFLMLKMNGSLDKPHPYQSSPFDWPFLFRGISYWSRSETREQIYMLGNIAGWYLLMLGIGLYVPIAAIDAFQHRRGAVWIAEPVRQRFHRSGGFFILLWAMHYFPFYIMSRSLFLHHYLPAVTCGYMVLGVMFQYFFVDGVDSPVSNIQCSYKPTKSVVTLKTVIAAAMIFTVQLSVFVFLAPLTYGSPSLSTDEIDRHKFYSSWDLQFAAKKNT